MFPLPASGYFQDCVFDVGYTEYWSSLVAQMVKNLTAMQEIPRSGRSPGKGPGYPLLYSCLENSMDRGAWQPTVHGVSKSWTLLSD